MNKNMNVPKLRFKEFSGEWDENKLESVVSLQSGFAFKSENFSEKGERLVIPKNFTKSGYGVFDEVNTKYTTEECDEKYVCKTDDLLILLTDLTPSCELLGKPLLVKEKDGKLLLNQRIAKVLPTDKIAVSFLQNFFLTSSYHTRIKNTATGSTVRHSSNKIILDTDIYLPSKQEQEKIASFLTSVDTKIEQLTRKEELLKQYKKGVMQKIFSQGIRFKADDGSEFCDWSKELLKNLVDKARKIRYGVVQPGNFDENGRYLIRGKDYSNGWEKPEEFFKVSDEVEAKYSKARVAEGDVILCIVGSVGNTMVIPDWLDGANITQTTARIAPIKEKLNNKYLFQYFQSEQGKKLIYTHMRVGTRPGLNIEDVEIFSIPLPELKEQTKIANFLSSIDSKIEQVQKQLNSTKEFKKALLQQMFI